MQSIFLLGIENIDRQHDELFRQLDQLLNTCVTRSCTREAASLLDFLDTYVATHFAAEEGLQRAGGYPGYEEHRRMHGEFIRNMAFIRTEIADKGFTDSIIQHVSQMLIEWFGRHVLEQDKRMSEFLAAASGSQISH